MWNRKESPHARIPVSHPLGTPPPSHSPPPLRLRLFILGRVHSCVVCSHRIQGSHSAGPRSQVPAARSADDLIAHQAHSAVSRPRPRMDSLGRKGRGGRGGTCGIGRRVPHVRIPVSHPLCTPPSPLTSSLTSQVVHPRTCSQLRRLFTPDPGIPFLGSRASGLMT